MGYWGVKSYENDDAHDALDAGFERVHGAVYEDLMDDRNPLTLEQVQQRLADGRTLEAAIAALEESVGSTLGEDPESWDEVDRLALAGVVVRHAELGVAIPDDLRRLAIGWLEHEDIDWDEATKRRLRRDKELALLRRAPAAPPSSVRGESESESEGS
jgi:hypothetical protein